MTSNISFQRPALRATAEPAVSQACIPCQVR